MLAQRAFTAPTGRSRRSLTIVAKESRIGRAPIPVPKGVTATIEGQHLKVKVSRRPLDQFLCGWSRQICWGARGCSTSNAGTGKGIETICYILQGPLGTLERTFTDFIKLEQVRTGRLVGRSLFTRALGRGRGAAYAGSMQFAEGWRHQGLQDR